MQQLKPLRIQLAGNAGDASDVGARSPESGDDAELDGAGAQRARQRVCGSGRVSGQPRPPERPQRYGRRHPLWGSLLPRSATSRYSAFLLNAETRSGACSAPKKLPSMKPKERPCGQNPGAQAGSGAELIPSHFPLSTVTLPCPSSITVQIVS
jgi:hypothetical protein